MQEMRNQKKAVVCKNKMKTYKTKSKTMEGRKFLSVISLNVNGLNFTIK